MAIKWGDISLIVSLLASMSGCENDDFDYLSHMKLSETSKLSLAREIRALESPTTGSTRYVVRYVVMNRDKLRVIRTPAIEKVFPDHDFVRISFSLRYRPEDITPYDALPGMVTIVFALNKRNGNVTTLGLHASDDRFCSFLVKEGITIRTNEEALTAWKALCRICISDPKDVQARRRFFSKLTSDLEFQTDSATSQIDSNSLRKQAQ